MNLKRIFYYYWQSAKKHRNLFFLVFLFYGIAVILSNTIHPILFSNVIDFITEADFHDVARGDALKLVYLFLINLFVYNIFFRVGDYTISAFESRGIRDVSKDTFRRLSKHSYNFYVNSFAGSLVAKAKRFASAFEGITDRISFDLFFIFLRITGVFVVLFLKVPMVGFAFLVWFLVYLFITYLFLIKKRKYDLASAEADSKVTGSLADVIANIFNLKIFSASKREQKRHDKVLDNQYKLLIRGWNFSNFQLVVQGTMTAILQGGSLYLMVNLWLKGEVSTGTVVLVQTYMIMLFDSLWNLGRSLMRLVKDLSNAQEMVDIFDQDIDIKDPENPEELRIKNGEIEFKNVSFEYTDENEVFHNFNLKLKAGERVGLIGHSGSGKSTITKMLLRFVDIKEGEILIDGQNIKNITQDDLRSKVSYVPQDPILFHRSIEENIGYSKKDASKEEVREAAKNAHADIFINNLPYGYDTFVGERGVKLSGGERQRVAIARAMLKDAPVLVLDEATSSLDSISESYIQDSLERLMQGKTTIVIAHRLSTILKMDRILVLDNGKIIEEGTHKELLERGGMYAEFWNHQTNGFFGK